MSQRTVDQSLVDLVVVPKEERVFSVRTVEQVMIVVYVRGYGAGHR